MKRTHLTLICAVLGAMILAPSTGAKAYVHMHCEGGNIKWNGTSKTLYYSKESFPAGDYETAIKNAVHFFNHNPGKFNYGLSGRTGSVGHGNNRSEIYGKNGIAAPAYASMRYNCYWWFGWKRNMKEVDVVFEYDGGVNWTTSTDKDNLTMYRGGGARGLRGTALHELGHGLYLKHENDEYNMMGADYSHVHVNGDLATFYLGEDAGDGAVHLYGTDSNFQDVGVVHWKYKGASGEYSTHEKTQIYNSAGSTVLSRVGVDYQGDGIGDEYHYRVSAGQSVKVEFTYENNGASTHRNVSCSIRLSTNNICSTYDRKLTGFTTTLGRADVYTYKKSVTLPRTLTSGSDYWLCAIIDDNNRISEHWEGNNATWLPIRVN
jgi:hypothetical protein